MLQTQESHFDISTQLFLCIVFQQMLKNFKNFGSKCYIKNNDEQLGKLEPRADEGILPTEKRISVTIKDLEELLTTLM